MNNYYSTMIIDDQSGDVSKSKFVKLWNLIGYLREHDKIYACMSKISILFPQFQTFGTEAMK